MAETSAQLEIVTQPAAAEPGQSPGNVGVAELAAEHEREIPRPDPNATEAELKKLGATLNREEFQIDDDGKPRLSKLTGSPKKKTGPKPKEEIIPAAPAGPDQFVMLGKVYAAVFFNVCVGVFGEEWKPAADQRAEITEAFEVYARAKNLITLPPEVLLAAALLGYVNDKPQVKAMRAKATAWVKSKVKTEPVQQPAMEINREEFLKA